MSELVETGQGEGGEVLGEEARQALVEASLPSSIELMSDGYNSICQRSREEAADLALLAIRPYVAALVAQARADAEQRWKGNAEAIGRALDQTEDQLRRETRQLRERTDELAAELDGARRATEMAARERDDMFEEVKALTAEREEAWRQVAQARADAR